MESINWNNEGSFDVNQILKTSQADGPMVSNDLASLNTNKNMPANIHILQIQYFNESRNYTCQAQNSFGLVVFNLTLVLKGLYLVFRFWCCLIDI